ncbi:HK97 family phage prohead protease [Clostridium botulinum D/C]|uniref:HK97 family phage prohead protease n=1 Tax=Clostridium botulinum TaxID=1491 RepID=UPI001E2F499D|nr:HK97 family phage prohead protease [Clostridium botulinum]MCD3234319.1 HK97 family phage prohead protease [Clostridium botulinum D/C]MCD3240303.1 HK97 family phage prohead protease [Clostridium botulinum D/C]MCD3267738.1 HK97 family phage prohead protease [Clostridium botulinum D/C]MCD3306135.1 HK97 family phage prohead protease [Clostridium botulinum D/C]MCD3314919.1 HK97 family phage prohead protease [Clostridium botulinum D/C]
MSKRKTLPQKNEREKRNFSVADIRAVEGDSSIDGHPAVYNQVANIGDCFYEVIEPGAFDNTNFDDVLFSVNHDLDKIPLARSRRNNGNSTMLIKLDEKGLYFKADLDTENNSDAKSLYSSVNRGDMNGMSFIFYIKEERWENLHSDMPTRHITDIDRVIEISAVSFPAYTGTDINTRDEFVLDNAKTALENARSKELDNSKNKKKDKRNNALEIQRLKIKIKAKG